MKINIEFNSDSEDLTEDQLANKINKILLIHRYERFLRYIEDDIFRPARKHGYPSGVGIADTHSNNETISKLEEMYYQAKEDLGIPYEE